MNLKELGRYIAQFLTIYVAVGFIIIMLKFWFNCLFKQCSSDYISDLILDIVYLVIPTEISVVELFSKFGTLILVIVLFYYLIFVKPHE